MISSAIYVVWYIRNSSAPNPVLETSRLKRFDVKNSTQIGRARWSMDQHRQVSRLRPIAQGCCGCGLRCSHVHAKRECVARNDERSREVFRWLSSLTAQVELEFAERTAEEIARREVAQQCAREGARRKGAAGGSNKRSRCGVIVRPRRFSSC